MLDDLRIAADDSNARVSRSIRHRLDLRLQYFRGKTGLQNERDHQGFGPDSGNRQIIHRAVHGKLPDRAARKAEWLHHKAVRGDRETSAVQKLKMGGVSERFSGRTAQKRDDQAFDQATAGLSARAVSPFDLRLAKADLGR